MTSSITNGNKPITMGGNLEPWFLSTMLLIGCISETHSLSPCLSHLLKEQKVQKFLWSGPLDCAQRLNPTLVEPHDWW